MSEQLQPESIATALAELDRRLRNLEASPRIGIGGAAQVEVSGTFQTITPAGAFPAGLTAVTDCAVAATATSSRVLVIVTATVSNLALSAGVFRSTEVLFTVFNTQIVARARHDGTASWPAQAVGARVLTGIVPRSTNTYDLRAWANNTSGAGALATIDSARLVVVPL